MDVEDETLVVFRVVYVNSAPGPEAVADFVALTAAGGGGGGEDATPGGGTGRAQVSLRVGPRVAACFVRELRSSPAYRRATAGFWLSLRPCHRRRRLRVDLRLLSRGFADDYVNVPWSHRIQHLVNERIELENLLSWLSTLGGAFSALGDVFEHCALIAGKISLHQWKLAVRCDDPVTASKCKIYAAVSLMQRSRFRVAEQLIRDQYAFAVSLPASARDRRLENMCHGVWAKLKYMRAVRRRSRRRRTMTASESESVVDLAENVPFQQV